MPGKAAGESCRSPCNTLRFTSAGSWQECRSSVIEMTGSRIAVSMASAITCTATAGSTVPLRSPRRRTSHNPQSEITTASQPRLKSSSTGDRQIIAKPAWPRHFSARHTGRSPGGWLRCSPGSLSKNEGALCPSLIFGGHGGFGRQFFVKWKTSQAAQSKPLPLCRKLRGLEDNRNVQGALPDHLRIRRRINHHAQTAPTRFRSRALAPRLCPGSNLVRR
jgi:hypothetical protein